MKGKLLTFSGPWFPHLQNDIENSSYLTGLSQGFSESAGLSYWVLCLPGSPLVYLHRCCFTHSLLYRALAHAVPSPQNALPFPLCLIMAICPSNPSAYDYNLYEGRPPKHPQPVSRGKDQSCPWLPGQFL